jgi:hypothetical protein
LLAKELPTLRDPLSSRRKIIYTGQQPVDLPEDWKRLKERLAQNAMTFINVGGAGNCLFLCIAAFVYKDASQHTKVRRVFANCNNLKFIGNCRVY